MVLLADVQASNACIASTLLVSLVGVFVGATAGIGETTLKQFAKHARQPRAYLIGRSQEAGERIVAECKTLNSQGEYIFIKADVSLIRIVDEVCEQIKAKEGVINILFLSAGAAVMDRRETVEGLHLLTALTYYSRQRFIVNLLPLIQKAPSLRRVVTVGGGSLEGPLDPDDFQALRVPLTSIRGHLVTLITLGLEAVARTAPDVGFVHDYPGTVNTSLVERMEGIRGVVMRAFIFLVGYWKCVPIEECGERHLFLATSARYRPASTAAASSGVSMADGMEAARGTNGGVGSGVYSVGWDCESAPPSVEKLLHTYREEGMIEDIRAHTEKEFSRITESE